RGNVGVMGRARMPGGKRGAKSPPRSLRSPPQMATVFTIGYERLLPPALVAELEAAGVERVIDVRYRPQSRRPGMSKTRLGQLLGDPGVAYEHRRGPGTPAALRRRFHAGPGGGG